MADKLADNALYLSAPLTCFEDLNLRLVSLDEFL